MLVHLNCTLCWAKTGSLSCPPFHCLAVQEDECPAGLWHHDLPQHCRIRRYWTIHSSLQFSQLFSSSFCSRNNPLDCFTLNVLKKKIPDNWTSRWLLCVSFCCPYWLSTHPNTGVFCQLQLFSSFYLSCSLFLFFFSFFMAPLTSVWARLPFN